MLPLLEFLPAVRVLLLFVVDDLLKEDFLAAPRSSKESTLDVILMLLLAFIMILPPPVPAAALPALKFDPVILIFPARGLPCAVELFPALMIRLLPALMFEP